VFIFAIEIRITDLDRTFPSLVRLPVQLSHLGLLLALFVDHGLQLDVLIQSLAHSLDLLPWLPERIEVLFDRLPPSQCVAFPYLKRFGRSLKVHDRILGALPLTKLLDLVSPFVSIDCTAYVVLLLFRFLVHFDKEFRRLSVPGIHQLQLQLL
jgi:hypothetical protein